MSVDLTGIWQGLYSYPEFGPHIGFTATLLEAAGTLHGTTHEVDVAARPLEASLAGERSGIVVRFTKVYAANDDDLVPIEYEGRVSGDGTEIEGTWAIPDGLTGAQGGRFLMSRPERKAASARARKSERV